MLGLSDEHLLAASSAFSADGITAAGNEFGREIKIGLLCTA